MFKPQSPQHPFKQFGLCQLLEFVTRHKMELRIFPNPKKLTLFSYALPNNRLGTYIIITFTIYSMDSFARRSHVVEALQQFNHFNMVFTSACIALS
jgi:hypothetical protein